MRGNGLEAKKEEMFIVRSIDGGESHVICHILRHSDMSYFLSSSSMHIARIVLANATIFVFLLFFFSSGISYTSQSAFRMVKGRSQVLACNQLNESA